MLAFFGGYCWEQFFLTLKHWMDNNSRLLGKHCLSYFLRSTFHIKLLFKPSATATEQDLWLRFVPAETHSYLFRSLRCTAFLIIIVAFCICYVKCVFLLWLVQLYAYQMRILLSSVRHLCWHCACSNVGVWTQRLCGMDCSGRLGVPPTLYCDMCMALFHPECVGFSYLGRHVGFLCQVCFYTQYCLVPFVSISK